MRQRGNEDAVSSEAWLEQTLDEILARVRELLGVTGCAFQVVDWERGQIRPAAAWFADEETREALDAVLTRPYDPERGGVTEAAIESGRPLLIDSVADWAGAERLHHRLNDQLGPAAAARAWAWYEGSSYISCPVRTAEGRTLGVLAISRAHPQPALTTEDLRVVEVFAGCGCAREIASTPSVRPSAVRTGHEMYDEPSYQAHARGGRSRSPPPSRRRARGRTGG